MTVATITFVDLHQPWPSWKPASFLSLVPIIHSAPVQQPLYYTLGHHFTRSIHGSPITETTRCWLSFLPGGPLERAPCPLIDFCLLITSSSSVHPSLAIIMSRWAWQPVLVRWLSPHRIIIISTLYFFADISLLFISYRSLFFFFFLIWRKMEAVKTVDVSWLHHSHKGRCCICCQVILLIHTDNLLIREPPS